MTAFNPTLITMFTKKATKAIRSREPEVGRAEAATVLPGGAKRLTDALDDYRRSLIRNALARANGSWAGAARLLGLHRSNLHHLAKRLGIRS